MLCEFKINLAKGHFFFGPCERMLFWKFVYVNSESILIYTIIIRIGNFRDIISYANYGF